MVPGQFYVNLQIGFPKTWDEVMEDLTSYPASQLQQLLNDESRNHLFRSDINIQLVTKVLVEQLNPLFSPSVFPPDRFNMAKMFRSIFLYYIRGICTDEGARITAEHFVRL